MRQPSADFETFDLVLATDWENRADLRAEAPPGTEHKVRLLRDSTPRPTSTSYRVRQRSPWRRPQGQIGA